MSDWHSGQPTPPPPGHHPAGAHGAVPPIAPPPLAPPPGGGHPGGPVWTPYGGFPPQPPKKTPWLPITLAVVGVLALIGIIVGAVLLLTGSDDDRSARSKKSPTPSASSSPSSSSSDDESADLPTATDPVSVTVPPLNPTDGVSVTGVWSGTYTCNQGETNLTLTIVSAARPDDLAAVFDFSPPAGTSGESGSFEMSGSTTAGKVDLTAGDWIDQPDGYSTVDLEGWVLAAQENRMFGNVLGSGCTTFELTRN